MQFNRIKLQGLLGGEFIIVVGVIIDRIQNNYTSAGPEAIETKGIRRHVESYTLYRGRH